MVLPLVSSPILSVQNHLTKYEEISKTASHASSLGNHDKVNHQHDGHDVHQPFHVAALAGKELEQWICDESKDEFRLLSFLVPNEALTGDKPQTVEIDGGGRTVTVER